MAVIRRTFTCLDLKCFNLLYKALVRPHLEYGVTTWSPYKVKDIEAIEKVQKRATKQKQVKQIRPLNYSDRLSKLNLPTLRYRRHRDDMIEVFKLLHNIYYAEITEGLLQLSNVNTTRGHSLKLAAQQSRLEIKYVVTVLQSEWSNLGMLYQKTLLWHQVLKCLNQDLTNSGTISLLNSTTGKSCVSKLTIWA